MSDIVFTALVDWDGDGLFEDTLPLIAIDEMRRGLPDDWRIRRGDVGVLSLRVDNSDRRYSPAYTGGPLYGKLVPGKSIILQAQAEADPFLMFTGRITRIVPTANRFRDQTVVIEAEDIFGTVQATDVVLPLLTGWRTDLVVDAVIGMADRSDEPDAPVVFSPAPADGNWLRVGHPVLGFETYRFRTVLAEPGDVKVGASAAESIDNLIAAIHNDGGVGTTYADGTRRSALVTASRVSTNILSLKAIVPGQWGFDMVATWTDGTGGPFSQVFSAFGVGFRNVPYDTANSDEGLRTLEVVGDQWEPSRVNVLSALEDVIDSEQGYVWVSRANQVVFKNYQHPFRAAMGSPAIILSDNQTGMDGAQISVDSVINRVTVSYRPRSASSGLMVLARASTIEVPGNSGQPRNNPAQPITAGMNVVKLKAIDPDTGTVVGIESIRLPLVPGVHYRVTDDPAGNGYDYTGSGRISITGCVNGTNIELSFVNTATGPLYVHDLYVEGVALLAYDKQETTLEDANSQAAYGKRAVTIQLPFASESASTFAALLCQFVLDQHADPIFEVSGISFEGWVLVNTVNLYQLEIGDMIQISETQLGITNEKFWITSIALTQQGQGMPTLLFRLRPIGTATYGVLDDATYGLLDSTTRLAL